MLPGSPGDCAFLFARLRQLSLNLGLSEKVQPVPRKRGSAMLGNAVKETVPSLPLIQRCLPGFPSIPGAVN